MPYVSRAGDKLKYALTTTGFSPQGLVCADFGSNTGGFVDCLLDYGAKKVYAIETGYGVLDWKLRNNENVIVMEKTNAMHIVLPEKVDLISIDTSWTRLEKIIPNALNNLSEKGHIIALVKPHYEAPQNMLRKGRLPSELVSGILEEIKTKVESLGLSIITELESPILGGKAKNKEFLLYMERRP